MLVGLADFALRAGASWPEALVTALNDKLEDESAPLTMAQREVGSWSAFIIVKLDINSLH